MNVNLNMFCILSLCIILCDQVKPQKILLLFWNKFHSVECVVVIICCLGAMNIKDCRTNDIRYRTGLVPWTTIPCKMVEAHKKIRYNLCFSPSFSIKLHCILSIPPVEYLRLSNRFCGRNNIEMGGGVKENRRPKPKNSKHSVSTLFTRDCSS